MRKEVYTIDGVTYTRVTKATARKLFNNGECVGICPAKIDPSNMWCGMAEFQKSHKRENWGFDDFVNCFVYYNCQEETGKYPKFFRKGD